MEADPSGGILGFQELQFATGIGWWVVFRGTPGDQAREGLYCHPYSDVC